MPKAFPSDIVALIDERFSWAGSVVHSNHAMQPEEAHWIAGLVDLLDRLPDGFLAVSRRDYARFVIARAALRNTVASSTLSNTARPWPVVDNVNAVSLVRRILSDCPDESQHEAVNGFEFISDERLRRALVSDLAAVERAAMNGEWKAATVLGGSLLEALLLWSIQKHRGEQLTSALERLPREIGKPRNTDRPETWSLVHYIEVARSLQEINNPAADAAKLARDFRNLIHPGREQRLGTKCDRATATSARAAVYHVIRTLSEKFASA